MSCVDSSVVSSSALFVLASSAKRPLFFSWSNRRYFSSSFFGIRAARAVVLGIENALLLVSGALSEGGGASRFERGMISELFRGEDGFLRAPGEARRAAFPGHFRAFRRPRSQRDFRETPSRFAARVRLPPARRSVSS